VSKIVDRSIANANDLVRELCEIGILKEMTGRKRNRSFAYSAYLDLFTDNDAAAGS
jgi:predicted transcriptional regulator